MSPNWEEIAGFARKWFTDTVSRLNDSGTDGKGDAFKLLALVQIKKLKDYVDLALEAFTTGRFFPGMALLRVVYESTIWMQWCIQDEGHVPERILIWDRYSFEEMRKFLEDISKSIPQAQTDLEQCRRILEEEYQYVVSQDFYATFTSLFKSLGKESKGDKEKRKELEKLKSQAYAMYRELCKYAHAHANIEEFTGPDGALVDTADMPVTAPYFSALVVFHLLWPIRKFFDWDNKGMLEEFLRFGFKTDAGQQQGPS